MKALKCGINAVGAQGRDCSSLLCHAHLKMGVLLHKQATVCSLMSMAVALISLPVVIFIKLEKCEQIHTEGQNYLGNLPLFMTNDTLFESL